MQNIKPSISIVAIVLALTPALVQAKSNQSLILEIGKIQCKGNNEKLIRNKRINVSDTAVTVSGNCDLKIVNSQIISDTVALEVSDNGTVVIQNSLIKGKEVAIKANNNSDVEYANTMIDGKIIVNDNSDVNNMGANKLLINEDYPELTSEEMMHEHKEQSTAINIADVVNIGNGRVSVPGVEINNGNVKVGGIVDIQGGNISVNDALSEVDINTNINGHLNISTANTVVDMNDGWLRIHTEDTNVNLSDWRVSVKTTYQESDTETLLKELNAKEENGNIKVDLAGDILFGFNKANVANEAASTLEKLAHVLRQKAEEVTVIGHTDSIGSDSYNKRLSKSRALSVMKWLNSKESIPASLMKAKGVGSKKPITHNTMPDGSDNPKGRAQNRRVEIVLKVMK